MFLRYDCISFQFINSVFYFRRIVLTAGMSKDEQERRKIYTKVHMYEADTVSVDIVNVEIEN